MELDSNLIAIAVIITALPSLLPEGSHQLRQLGDIRRNPPRLVFREQLGRRSPAA
jgi:hypothetical protein